MWLYVPKMSPDESAMRSLFPMCEITKKRVSHLCKPAAYVTFHASVEEMIRYRIFFSRDYKSLNRIGWKLLNEFSVCSNAGWSMDPATLDPAVQHVCLTWTLCIDQCPVFESSARLSSKARIKYENWLNLNTEVDLFFKRCLSIPSSPCVKSATLILSSKVRRL